MSRSTCQHLQTIIQVNPADLCIQKKVKHVELSSRGIPKKRRLHHSTNIQQHTIVATTSTDGGKNVYPICTYGLKKNLICIARCDAAITKNVFIRRESFARTARKLGRTFGYACTNNACTSAAPTNTTTTARCTLR